MSVTDTPRRDPVGDDLRAGASAPLTPARGGRRSFPVFPLGARILAINVMALGVLVAGFFYLDHYQRDLMHAKLDSLAREATLLATTLGASAAGTGDATEARLDRAAAEALVRRLNFTTDTRTVLFDSDGTLAIDSRQLPMAAVHTTELPPPEESRGFLGRTADAAYEWITARLPPHTTVPLYTEPKEPRAADFPKVLSALEVNSSVLLVGDTITDDVVRAVRNIPKARTLPVSLLNAVDLLNANKVVMTVDAVRKAEEIWGGEYVRIKRETAAVTADEGEVE